MQGSRAHTDLEETYGAGSCPAPFPFGVTLIVFGILPVPAGWMRLWCSPSASYSSSTASSTGNLSS